MNDTDTRLISEAYSELTSNEKLKLANHAAEQGKGPLADRQSTETKFDFPYTNGQGGAPRPEFLEHELYQGSFYIQQFGPGPADQQIQYKNHNPLGNKLEPGEFFEVTVNWSWDGESEAASLYSPGSEAYIHSVQVERIVDEDEQDVNEPIKSQIERIVHDTFENAGESDMEVYGWSAPDSY